MNWIKDLYYLDVEEHRGYVFQMINYVFAVMFALFVKTILLVVQEDKYGTPFKFIFVGIVLLMLYNLKDLYLFKLKGFFANSFIILVLGIGLLQNWIVTIASAYLTLCIGFNFIYYVFWRNKK